MNEVVAPAVTVTRLGSSSPDRTTAAADDDDWLERVSAAAAVGTSRSSIIGRDDDDGGGSRPARLAVLVPFREDEDGTRGPQLTRFLRRLRDVFRGVAPVGTDDSQKQRIVRGDARSVIRVDRQPLGVLERDAFAREFGFQCLHFGFFGL